MRSWLVLLALLLSGCAEVERPEAPVESQWVEPVHEEPEVRPPSGRIEVRWPDGAWEPFLSWSGSSEVNATGAVTELSRADLPDRFEARFVGDLDPNATWNLNWWTWSPACCGGGGSSQGGEVVLPVSLGQTVVAFDAWSDRSPRNLHLETTVAVAVDWVVRGVVQPLPAQAPGAPPVVHEVRVPVGGVGGALRLTTEAVGDAPATGRDLRLGYKMLHDEWCMGAPTPGTMDNAAHLLEVPLWGEATTVQVFVGNPSGWCAGALDGPLNAVPVEYVLRVQVAQAGAYGYGPY